MNFDKMDSLLAQDEALGFNYWNNEKIVNWMVIADDGMVVMRKTVILCANEALHDGDTEYFMRSYDDIDGVESLYTTVVSQFVDFYHEDFCNRTGDEYKLFDDIANPNDEDVLEFLAFFGKTYGDFIRDLLFWLDMLSILAETMSKVNRLGVFNFLEKTTHDVIELMFVDKLMDNYCDGEIFVSNDDTGEGFYWKFATIDNLIWYWCEELRFDFYRFAICDEKCGCFRKNNDSMKQEIRQEITMLLLREDWRVNGDSHYLELLGIA